VPITTASVSRRPLVSLAALAIVVIGASAPACAQVAPATMSAAGQATPSTARPGFLVGRVVFPDGRPVPKFTIEVSGFGDGVLAATGANGNLRETVVSRVNGTAGHYEVALPAGAYRASGWTTVLYQGRTYNFELEGTSEPAKFDYDALALEKLRGGIVRDFKAGMTDRKKDADEAYEMGYYHAFYGGMIKVDSQQTEYQVGGGAPIPPSLHDSYPADSKIEITLTPQGPMVDGTTGPTAVRTVRIGDDGKWTFVVRAIYPGMYTATARLLPPTGAAVPLRVSLTAGKTELHPGGYDRVVMDWHSSVTVDFLPNDLGPAPQMGVKDVVLYFGK
jgi:hypothetical protein